MTYFVKKLEWEYGEQYGHAYYPQDFEDFQAKLRALDGQAVVRGNPFYLEVFFLDDSYLGLIVGHALSCFNFGIFVSDNDSSTPYRTQFDSHYEDEKEGDPTFITYSFKGDHGEKRLAEMLSKEQAFDAVYQYIDHKKFPSYIRFSKQELIDTYIKW
jgi:hypothetical protein